MKWLKRWHGYLRARQHRSVHQNRAWQREMGGNLLIDTTSLSYLHKSNSPTNLW